MLSHFLRSTAKLVLVLASTAARARVERHDERGAGTARPAFLRRADQHVDARRLHVDPHRARGDAIEHEHAAMLVRGVGDRADVRVGKDDAGCGFHVRREHDVGTLAADRGDDLGDRRRRVRRLAAGAHGARLEHGGARRDAAHVEDLRPAIAEPAVAQHEAALAGGELASDGFHAEGAAAGNHRNGIGVVDLAQRGADVAHDALEAPGHVIERAVGEDDGIFEESVGVDVG